MKTKITSFLLVAFLFIFASCQNEIAEIVETTDGEVLEANAVVTSLIQKTVTNDGSKDNIIDGANCISVQLPISVVVNGLEIIIDSEEDFEVIEDIFDEFEDDIDDLDIIYPIVITLSDFSEVTINNYDELEGFISECEDENEIDDDIECLDFVYPISLSVFDSASQVAQTVTVNNDKDFYEFIDDIDENDVVEINFPISVVLYDGTQITINNLEALENTIDDVKDECDEDDDNDYNDDDCNDCTQEQISELLMSCSWSVDKIEIDDVDNTEQYLDYTFTFLEDGTVVAESGGNEIIGTWIIDNSGNDILVKINFNNFSDFTFDWVLHEIEENNEIELRYEDNRLELEKNCIEGKTELIDTLNEGSWIVAYFNDDGDNETATYNDYVLDFKEDFTVSATKNDDVVYGIWIVNYDDDKLKLELDFNETEPFDEFDEDWIVVDVSEGRVEVNDLDDSGNEESNLVFERL